MKKSIIPETYIMDVSMGEPYCYMPYEVGIGIITMGMNFIGFVPKGGKVVGIFHQDGQEAAEKWCKENPDWIKKTKTLKRKINKKKKICSTTKK
jgi:hypothetical protein